MPHLGVADRVKETTTTTGTGTINLGGAETGFQTFVDGIGNGHETYYVIAHQSANEWEVGYGTITDAATDTLSRTTVLSSSNAGSLVNFSAGTKDVFCSLPSEKAVLIDGEANISVTANMTATSFAGSGAALTSLNATNVASGTLDNARLDQQLQDVAGLTPTSGKFIQGDGANFTISAYSVPTVDGTSGQVLTTNGSGAVTFQTPTVGDITAVTAGSGLTGGGTSGDVTLNVGAGTGVTVNADDIAIGQDVATSASPTFAGGTFTANVAFGDLDFVNMGPTGEFQIYHDHANGVSVVKDVDAGGSINVQADTINLTGPVVGSSTVNAATFNGSGAGLTTLNASNVSSGTLPNARLDAQLQDVAGLATTSGKVIQGNGTNFVLSAYALPTTDGTSGQVLTTNGSGTLSFATPTVGDITAVTAGNGLTGGGTSGDVTLNVGAGTGVTVAADTVSIGQDVATSASPTFAGATFTANVSLGDNDYLNIGASNDLQISHQGTDTYINEQGTGALNILSDGTGIFLKKGVTEDMAKFNTDGAVELYYDNVKKFETTSAGATVNGALTTTSTITSSSGTSSFDTINISGELNLTASGTENIIDFAGTEARLRWLNSSPAFENIFRALNNGAVELYYDGSKKFETTSSGIAVTGGATFTANVSLGDQDYLRLGDSSDLILFHDGGNSVIRDQGTGNLFIDASTTLTFRSGASGESYCVMNHNGSVDLYYDNSKKLETTSAGVTVTGTLTETSSIEYKENVQPLQFNEAIYNVNAVKYDRKDGSAKDEVGVIAEELYEILPDLVETKEGKPDSVKYTKLTMYLLEALKKQNQEIQELKKRLN